MRWAQLNTNTSIATKEKTRRRGFTIVELLIVIVVIAILAAISVVAYTGIQNRAMIARAERNLGDNYRILESYRALNGQYPAIPAQLEDANLRVDGGAYRNADRAYMYCVSGDAQQAALVAELSVPGEYRSYSLAGGLRTLTAEQWGATGAGRCNNAAGVDYGIGIAGIMGVADPTWDRWTNAR